MEVLGEPQPISVVGGKAVHQNERIPVLAVVAPQQCNPPLFNLNTVALKTGLTYFAADGGVVQRLLQP